MKENENNQENNTDLYGYRYDQNPGEDTQTGNRDYQGSHRQDYNNNVKSAALASTALTIAIAGIISGFIVLIIVPMIMAGVAIVMALISRSDRKHFYRPARAAIILSTISLAANSCLLGVGIHTIYRFNTDPAYHEEVNDSMRKLTGYSLDDYIQLINGEVPQDDQSGQTENNGQTENDEQTENNGQTENGNTGSGDSELPDGVQEMPYPEDAGEVTL